MSLTIQNHTAHITRAEQRHLSSATPVERPLTLASAMFNFINVGLSKQIGIPQMTDDVRKVMAVFQPSEKYGDGMYVTPELADGTRMELDYLSDVAFLRIFQQNNKLYSQTPLPYGTEFTTYLKEFVVNENNLLPDWKTWAGQGPAEELRTDALERVSECVKNSNPVLDLSNLNLSNIPPHLPLHITTLIIDGNQLKTLPSLPAGLSELRAKDNQLSRLPELIPSSLTTVDLSNNQLTAFPLLPPAVTTIDLSGNKLCRLQGIPQSVTHLFLSNNPQICVVIPDFKEFRNLKEINLDGLGLKKLPSLPPTITRLTLNNNPLHTIPALIEFTQLEALSINNTHIKKLPHLPIGLKYFSANDNELMSLPYLPPSLKQLELINNKLSIFCADLLPGLETLNLADNQLSYIMGPFSHHLKKVDLQNNRLIDLPALPEGLEELILENNKLRLLRELPKSLQVLHIDFNRLILPPVLPGKLLRKIDSLEPFLKQTFFSDKGNYYNDEKQLARASFVIE